MCLRRTSAVLTSLALLILAGCGIGSGDGATRSNSVTNTSTTTTEARFQEVGPIDGSDSSSGSPGGSLASIPEQDMVNVQAHADSLHGMENTGTKFPIAMASALRGD